MQNTPVQGTFNRLFEGHMQNVIKCINVDYESCRDDTFNTIQLRVRGNATIEESVKQYIQEERLDGQN
jgi:ubiquitin carboxyl-terminal hydrolase 7